MKAFQATILALCCALPASADDGKEDWKPLFNGKDLAGWEHVGPGEMVVENGVVKTVGGMGLLWYTREKLGNCVLRVVYKTASDHSNSGVFIRIADKPKDEWFAVHHGFEVQIDDAGDDYHRTGAIYSLSRATAKPGKVGEWNTMEIVLKGDRVLVTVNGVPVNDFDSTKPVPPRTKDYEPKRGPRPESGYVGIQNHDGRPGAEVFFKEISVRPLSDREKRRK